jgi:hypothetical protein
MASTYRRMGGSLLSPGSRLNFYAFTMPRPAKNVIKQKLAVDHLIQLFCQTVRQRLSRALSPIIWPSLIWRQGRVQGGLAFSLRARNAKKAPQKFLRK